MSKVSVPVDLRVKSHPVVLTPDLAERVVREASFRCVAKACVCRAERDCQTYPVDIGCLYLGQGARGIVAKGNAAEISFEEALGLLRRAREQKLVHMVLWTSGELRSLGADASRAVELCSCCPCCCISRRIQDSTLYVDAITGLGIARMEGDCVACGECKNACPFGAILLEDEGHSINPDRCKGCGRCERACGQRAITVYNLEMVPDYADGWEMIPADSYLSEILKAVKQ